MGRPDKYFTFGAPLAATMRDAPRTTTSASSSVAFPPSSASMVTPPTSTSQSDSHSADPRPRASTTRTAHRPAARQPATRRTSPCGTAMRIVVGPVAAAAVAAVTLPKGDAAQASRTASARGGRVKEKKGAESAPAASETGSAAAMLARSGAAVAEDTTADAATRVRRSSSIASVVIIMFPPGVGTKPKVAEWL